MAVTFGDPKMQDRFWAQVVVVRSGCWEWVGYLRKDGYGEFNTGKGSRLAHRRAYLGLVGPIEDALTLDHLCRNRRCVRPSHLEPVIRGENVLRGEGLAAQRARKTKCLNGHPLSGDNVSRYARGNSFFRVCNTCRRKRRMESYERNREAEKSRMRAYYKNNKEKWK